VFIFVFAAFWRNKVEYIFIISLCLREYFQINKKMAKVVPINEKGDKSLASNYGPISLLSMFDCWKNLYIKGSKFFWSKIIIYLSINLDSERIILQP